MVTVVRLWLFLQTEEVKELVNNWAKDCRKEEEVHFAKSNFLHGEEEIQSIKCKSREVLTSIMLCLYLHPCWQFCLKLCFLFLPRDGVGDGVDFLYVWPERRLSPSGKSNKSQPSKPKSCKCSLEFPPDLSACGCHQLSAHVNLETGHRGRKTTSKWEYAAQKVV